MRVNLDKVASESRIDGGSGAHLHGARKRRVRSSSRPIFLWWVVQPTRERKRA
jgi:hypothetical protein